MTGSRGGPPVNGTEAPRRWRFGDDPALPVAVVVRGGILAIPTESSYGLAVDPTSRRGVEAIYRIKRREAGRPLPVVVAGTAQLARLGVDPAAPQVAWAARRWPAALTVVLPLAAAGSPLPAAAGGGSVAVRVPDHPRLVELLAATGPLTATSANLSGDPPILDPDEVAALLAGADALVVDDGRLPGGPPSTLVAFEGGQVRVLRHGRVPSDALTAP
ncbi:MAG TPA: L-threonylcarbamoyladenylate synthase [Thermoanaerobaculia bacterium]|nr:L-threonylcarbamoyladenylate synthase [Thermoanaerobaculia bacterium]